MAKKRRLLYKDLDALRFLAFLPVFLYCAFYLVSSEQNAFAQDAAGVFGYLKQNSIDFFFFLSAFLLTSHGLREYKYNKSFALKSFYIRRLIKILPVFAIAILFTFIVHPWIISTLKLTSIAVPKATSYLLLFPNYFAELTTEQYIYLAVIWTVYMFLQFYVFWGFILKFFSQQIKYIGYGLIGIGIASRVYHILLNTPYEFDTLSAGIPIGIGAIVAHTMRNEDRLAEAIKHLTKGNHIVVYAVGVTSILLGYLFFGNTYVSAIIPIITCMFYAYVVFEQTYGKNSIFKLRKSKILSRFGKISYGFIVYQSIIMVVGVISIDSLDLDLSNPPIQIAFIVLSFLLSWLVADLSYNIYERPILAIKNEFKKS